MSKIAPWLSLAVDWMDSEMFDDANEGVRLGWVCLLCLMKAQGRAGRVRFRASLFANNYRLKPADVDELFARAAAAGALVKDGDLVTVTNWKSYQDPRARSLESKRHNPKRRKVVTSTRRHFSKSTENDATHHPAPTTQHPPPPVATNATTTPTDEWAGVVDLLLGFGIAKAADAVAACRAAGCSPQYVGNCIEHWRANRPAWGPGALYERLLRLKSPQSVTDLWPEPDGKVTAKIKRDHSAQLAAEQRAANDKRRQQRQAEDEVHARREKELGPRLDAMPSAAVKQFIRARWPEHAEFYLKRLNGNPDGLLRRELLEALEQTTELDS